MSEPKTPYEILGLVPGASPQEVKEAYIELAKTWHPLFIDDEQLRRAAEEKMEKIDAAYDALNAVFRSAGYGHSVPERKNVSRGGGAEGSLCESPGCTGIVGANGRCELCGKSPVSDERGYAIYCPSCGTRNYIRNKRDYDRGTCFQCRAPFRDFIRPNRTTSRKLAYLVLLTVLIASVWLFFVSSESPNGPPKKYPVTASPPQPALSTADEPPATITPEPEEGPPPVESTAPEAEPPEGTPPAVSTAPEAESPQNSAPSVSGNSDGPKQEVYQADQIRPEPDKKQSNERYEELIDHVLKQKSINPQKHVRVQ